MIKKREHGWRREHRDHRVRSRHGRAERALRHEEDGTTD
jgi:hypothetical protein